MQTQSPASDLRFPQDFVWGVATSSYQIEGAVAEDGRLPSIWDDFSHTPGKVKDGTNGDVACDHYHRFEDDIALMKSLGVHAYRFSIAWPRVLPEGTGRVEPRGLDFYSRLVDALLKAGITPYATLYHWDLPSALQARGGWENREITGWFADYASVVVRALGDRVTNWMTINEPWCVSFLSHELGLHAPGKRDPAIARRVAHHCNLAHGAAMQAIRAASPQPCRAGAVLNFEPQLPLTDSPEDRQAADEATRHDVFINWFAAPLLTGRYANDAVEPAQRELGVTDADLALIAQPIDFLGINNYTVGRMHVVDGKASRVRNPGAEYTMMDWEVAPQGLHTLLHQLHAMSAGKVPLYVTENGCSYRDVLSADGRVHDSRRVEYLRGHFAAAQRAISEGVDLRGYFVWSLMDNFEWGEGYDQFFGIVHVDYASQKRTPKDSAYWVRDVIAANRVL